MPIYEYRCPDCEHAFEVLQKISEDPIKDCPECEASGVEKLISRTSFVLKGGGWYKDHYGLKSSASDTGRGEATGGGADSGGADSGGADSGGADSGGADSSASKSDGGGGSAGAGGGSSAGASPTKTGGSSE